MVALSLLHRMPIQSREDRRDVTLREDTSQVRKGTAPRVQAVLNSFLLVLLDFLGVRNVAKQIRLFDTQPRLSVRLLLGSLLTFK
jgi:hypothetical protein